MAAKRRNALRTPEQAREWLRESGITVVAFAKQHGLSRDAVNDALRGVGKGNFGKSHAAAVALGMKRDPDSGTKALKNARPEKKPAKAAKRSPRVIGKKS